MLRRRLDAAFVGGAYVFPGGALDPGDRAGDVGEVCQGRSPEEASGLLGVSSQGLAWWVAAVRECFEEAGVLLAYGKDGQVISLSAPGVAHRFGEYRLAVHAGSLRLADLCRAEGLRLAVDRLHPWSHWITPPGLPRRFNTRFFVARMPEGQEARHDERETIDQLWTSPATALARHGAGQLDLTVPTIRNLESIAAFGSSRELVEAASLRGSTPAIQPRVVQDEDGIRVLLPGDPGYETGFDGPEVMLPLADARWRPRRWSERARTAGSPNG
jgi:8-oxo-dGTP pyrophosphatase MutT (NUDIX family)